MEGLPDFVLRDTSLYRCRIPKEGLLGRSGDLASKVTSTLLELGYKRLYV